jgi:uncharacterized protein YeaC (DUF1315 family)
MNKYNQWYNSIIENARDRTLSGYKESHHIVPQSLGGSETKENLVDLTAREHFVCHWLLIKMHTGEARAKMVYALNGMKRTNKKQERYETAITSRVYQKLKEEFGKTHSAYMKGRTPWNKGVPVTEEQREKNRQAALGKKHSTETKEKISKAQLGTKQKQETKDKISASLTGIKRGPMSEEHRQKRSDALKGKAKNLDSVAKRQKTLKRLAAEGTHHSMVKVTCPHCAKEVTKLVYGRLHGARCGTLQDK